MLSNNDPKVDLIDQLIEKTSRLLAKLPDEEKKSFLKTQRDLSSVTRHYVLNYFFEDINKLEEELQNIKELRSTLDNFEIREITRIDLQIIEIDRRLAAAKQKKESEPYSNENLLRK